MDRRERLNDPLEALRIAIEGQQSGLWTALPCIVNSFDPAAQTVSAQPAVEGTVTSEDGGRSTASLPLLVDVPVVFPAGGGFTLTFPVRAGDECLVVFASRCIDGWWQAGGVQPPAERRMHDLSDGLAIVGPRSQARRLSPSVDAENVQLRSDDGEQHITITPAGEMTCRATTSLVLEAPLVTIKGLLTFQSIDGGPTTATLQGSLHATEDLTAQAVSLIGHVHEGVQPGSGLTGVPDQ